MYWELFAEPLQRRYRSDCWSLATWFTVAVWLTRLLLPAYVAWQTKNLWVKDLTYVEQPYVSFQNQLIVEAHNAGWSGTAGGAGVPVVVNSPTGALPYTLLPIAWSSIDAYQRIVGFTRGRQPSVRASAVDTNHDQKPDRLNVTVTVPKRSDVHSVAVVLLFDVELSGQVLLNMQSAVTLSAADAQSCSHVYFTGDLHFSQRSPIAVGTRRVIYNTPIVDAANITSIDDVLIPNIQAIAQSRNETLVVERAQTHWVGGGQFSDNFVIHIALTIPPQRIRYTPGLGEVLKNGWIQWLALFAIVYGVTWWITHWLYAHRILDVAYSDDVNPVGRPFINY